MKQVFIHIGYGKCGTTAIQQFAYKNFNKNSKVFLPLTGWWKEGEGHHHLANNLNRDVNEEGFSKRWQQAAEELEKSGVEIGFISSEQFCFLKPPQVEIIHEVLSKYNWEVKIIFFVRSQLELALSSYMQKLKFSKYQDIGNFEKFFSLHKNSFDFQYRIDIWEKLFGLDNLIVRLYDRKLFDNVIDELNKILKIDIEINKAQLPGSNRVNRSIIPEFIDLIKFFDEIYDGEGQKRKQFINELILTSNQLSNASSGIKLFSKEENLIIEHFKEKNKRFANKFLTFIEKKALIQKFSI